MQAKISKAISTAHSFHLQTVMALVSVTSRPFCSPCSSLLKQTAKSPKSFLPFLSCPSRQTPRRLIQAAAASDNKDSSSSSLEVQQSNKRDTAVERRPRRSAFDISPFGKQSIKTPNKRLISCYFFKLSCFSENKLLLFIFLCKEISNFY